MKHIGLIYLSHHAQDLQARCTPPPLRERHGAAERQAIPVWGPPSRERFTITFVGKTREVVADDSGTVHRPSEMKDGGPFTMNIGTLRLDGHPRATCGCAQAANMDVTVERVAPQYAGQVETYRNDRVRLLRVNQHATVEGPQRDFQTSGWKHLTPADSWTFSALGYFLGRRLQEQTGVPQGIICNSWGGTPIEAGVPADSLGGPYSHYLDRRDIYTTDYVTAQRQANTVMDNRWHDLLDRKDPGLHQGWTGLEADDSRWPTHNQYDKAWAQVDGRGVVGSVWMRQHIHLDKAHAGRAATLLLGTLYDADYTFVNGKQVGVTYYQYPPRRYKVPEGLLREGDTWWRCSSSTKAARGLHTGQALLPRLRRRRCPHVVGDLAQPCGCADARLSVAGRGHTEPRHSDVQLHAHALVPYGVAAWLCTRVSRHRPSQRIPAHAAQAQGGLAQTSGRRQAGVCRCAAGQLHGTLGPAAGDGMGPGARGSAPGHH
jgi:hypothetical protein